VSTVTGDHLSIGEVLAALRDEFPDITFSKIRFLESQGLIDPERTPSGYRKFYAADLARLRWILLQQKENFLPLKVIKERLDALGPGEIPGLDPEPGPVPAEDPVEPAPVPPAAPPESGPGPGPGGRRTTTARPRPQAFAPSLPVDDDSDDSPIAGADAAGAPLYTRDALCAQAGLDAGQLAALEEFGLVTPARESGDAVEFDADAVEIAQIASGFFARGLEARHLRMYRTFAEREAVLFGQVLLPLVRQRNPESRARLQDELVELAGLGRRLRMVLLREAVRDTLAE
jgi:DNA-binding transcriptional MerR regulator